MKPGNYSVRLVFVDPANTKAGERVFDVSLQGKGILKNFDVVKESGGRMRALTKTQRKVAVGEDGRLWVELKTKTGTPVLSGIELIRDGLKADEPVVLKDKVTTPLR